MASAVPASDLHRCLDDQRISGLRPLLPPAILLDEIPSTDGAARTVYRGREAAQAVLERRDDRLIVVVGPCSIHDPTAAIEYARLLRDYAATAESDLVIIMRAYFEKPRTTRGWKGLVRDPTLDDTFNINKGFRIGRRLLVQLNEIGLPLATEFLDTISPQFVADQYSWGAIGARTTESQVHRELASGLSMPIGYKNSTDGSVSIAIDAIKSSEGSHTFLSVTKQGVAAIVETTGNPHCHVILRGGSKGTNYDSQSVAETAEALKKAGLEANIMIDCSHGNSSKQHLRQIVVADDIAGQLSSAVHADSIVGVMIESNLVEGKQAIPTKAADLPSLTYGQSVTDACISWEQTVKILDGLRRGVQARRQRKAE